MFESMEGLSKSERVKLRRAAGKMLNEVDADTMGAFYAACHCKEEYEEKAFLVACLLARQEHNGNTQLADAWKEHLIKSQSKNMGKRMTRLLDMRWDDNFARSLCRIVKMLDTKDVDYEKLVWDVIHWDDEDRQVQRKWLKMIHIEKTTERK